MSPFLGHGWGVACGGSEGLHRPARGWWAQARPRGRQGGSVRVWGKVVGPHGPGGAGYLGPRRAGPGLGKHVQRKRTGCLSLSRPSPGALWAPGYCRGPPSQPPGGQEEHTSRRPEPGSEICLPELTRASEIRHKITSEQSV